MSIRGISLLVNSLLKHVSTTMGQAANSAQPRQTAATGNGTPTTPAPDKTFKDKDALATLF